MFINCNYDYEYDKVVYNGFEVTHSSNPSLNKTFKTDNPPKDYRDAIAYAIEHSDGYVGSSSSVDNFVSDSDEFGWYENEYGEECFDYLDDILGLEQAAEEKKQLGMNSLIFYFKHTLGVNDNQAKILAESNYENFAQYIVPLTLKYQEEHK
jgi:hypothetical protein